MAHPYVVARRTYLPPACLTSLQFDGRFSVLCFAQLLYTCVSTNVIIDRRY